MRTILILYGLDEDFNFMQALVLRHKTTPAGVVIVHDTNEPVLVGDTPLSSLLLNKYINGFTIVVYDRSVYKRREGVIPPKDLKYFMSVGVQYFSLANMTLSQENYNSLDKCITINGVTYPLKEIT